MGEVSLKTKFKQKTKNTQGVTTVIVSTGAIEEVTNLMTSEHMTPGL